MAAGPFLECVGCRLKEDVPNLVFELAVRFRAVRFGRAVKGSSGKEGADLGDGNPVEHVLEDVLAAFVLVGFPTFESLHQPSGDLSEQCPRFTRGVEPFEVGVFPDLFWQQVQHGIGRFGWGEHLVRRKVRQTGQDVWPVTGRGFGALESRLHVIC